MLDKNAAENDFTLSIGAITIRYALLEDLIRICVNILVGGEGANIATSKLSFQSLLDALSALYKQTPKSIKKEMSFIEMDELISLAEKAAVERNKIVHSIWYVHTEDSEKPFTRVKNNLRRKTGLIIDMEKMSPADLKNVIAKLDDAIIEAQVFIDGILNAYGSVSLTSPADAAEIDSKPEFKWESLKHAIGYEIAISTEIYFSEDSTVIRQVKEAKYAFEAPLEDNRTYYWKVRSLVANTRGFWSEIRRFTIK